MDHKSLAIWKISIDTGGTFTDCIGRTPEGESVRCKVLSNGTLRFQVQGVRTGQVITASGLPPVSSGFFVGYSILAGPEETDLGTIREDRLLKDGLRELELGWERSVGLQPGDLMSLSAFEEAPVMGFRLLTDTGLQDEFPAHELRLGTTKGTNALLEEKGDLPVLFVSPGYSDLLEIGDQRRPELFAREIRKPRPLTGVVVEVPGRVDARGVELQPFEPEGDWLTLAKEYLLGGATTAAISFMHGYSSPDHEIECERLLKDLGYSYVARGSKLAPFIKYLHRTQTTVVDAYLGQLMTRYFDGVESKLGSASQLYLMSSGGGLRKRTHYWPKDSLLSGPAGGVVGVAAVARRSGISKVLALDMGGTSTDVSRYDGQYDYVTEHEVGRAHLMTSALRIETVAAGGGSICGFEHALFFVGPESAGAFPGPACYGYGGPLTLTDVNLLLGRMNPGQFNIPVFPERAREAATGILEQARSENGNEALSLESMLNGFLAIANERMALAMNKISVREGFDPSEYALVAFGGAGGQHACALADRLGITRIIIPPEAGILSAYGCQHAEHAYEDSRQILRPLEEVSPALLRWAKEIWTEGEGELQGRDQGQNANVWVHEAEVGLRLKGQDLELFIPLRDDSNLEACFVERFSDIFGYFPEGREIEVSRLRCRVIIKAASVEAEAFEADSTVAVEACRVETNPFSTFVKDPGWTVFRGDQGTILLESTDSGEGAFSDVLQNVSEEILTQRFKGLVEEMGVQLQRTSLSTNIKERLDFSCGLLDAEGHLIVNAPHIPVHLGALGVCVRKVKSVLAMEPGDIVIVNHPRFGGSHLPDVTLICPVYLPGHSEVPIAYLANRAHHAEIGGIRPGSMPPNARVLGEEGVVIEPRYLYRRGEAHWDDIRSLLASSRYPSRNVEENLADLQGQVASLRKGHRVVIELCNQLGPGAITGQMSFLRRLARTQLQPKLREIVSNPIAGEQLLDDGSQLKVKVSREGDQICIDFSGTSQVHPRNLNANPAIVQSAVMYVLRMIAGDARELPLNDGFLEDLTWILPECMLNPVFPDDPFDSPAVVGGNVEVSQALTDLLLKVFGIMAGGQGTMNNFLFGNDRVSYYETLGGGSGAGPGFSGASGVHVHMSNTAITDPEIFEHRYPVRLNSFAIREGSGGDGKWRGGDGLVRDLTFLESLRVSLLTQHRVVPPAGGAGGFPGQVGQQTLVSRTDMSTLPGEVALDVKPGDTLRIETPGGGGWGVPE